MKVFARIGLFFIRISRRQPSNSLIELKEVFNLQLYFLINVFLMEFIYLLNTTNNLK